MKTRLTELRHACLAALLTIAAGPAFAGDTFDNTSADIVWAMSSSTTDQPTTLTPDGAFSVASVAVGSSLTENKKSYDGTTYVTFQPSETASAASENHSVQFIVKPKSGVTFTPSHVQANIIRFGTDGGSMDIVATTAEGESVTLGTAVKPMRNKAGSNGESSFSYDISGLSTTSQLTITVYIYSLGDTKQVGINGVELTGTVSGTAADVASYTVTSAVSPEGAGTVTMNPNGSTFDAGTEVTFSAARNFGYKFVNWTDKDGNELSTEAKFTHTVSADQVITANYQAISTYSLDVAVEGGANDYMVEWSPEPTVIDGKNMYEEGTEITLTATSNPIITFANWDDGTTSSIKTFTITEDKSYTATYSATDFIAGWDFYLAGSNGRTADFFAADNDADQLVMRNESGETSSWLDKCKKNGGYEGRNAAVNWRTTGLGDYYWQTKVNAEAFTDITVTCEMAYNYNAYTTQNVDYSLDGENWTNAGQITISGTKNWTSGNFTLPEEANNQKEVYIRWKSDKTSSTDGTTSNNDGIAIANIYILGTAKLVDDGTAPQLVSSVPETGGTGASANGKIVLTFDEKVQAAENAAGTLNGVSISPVVSGKTVMFEYTGLEYNTEYTFTLPAGSISDLTGNSIASDITITFTTMSKPAINKALFDFVVPDDGTLDEGLTEAGKRDDTSKRFRIFIKKGSYQLPVSTTLTKTSADDSSTKTYADPTTYISTPNISIIGEDMEETSVTNTITSETFTNAYGEASVLEGIGRGDVLSLSSKATDLYFQDLTMKSSMGDGRGRDIVLNDKSNRTIMKDVCLHAYQDTYVSNNENGVFYFEGGRLRGRTDYLCGKGDVYYNGVELMLAAAGGYVTAPSKAKKYGYVFNNCVINSEVSGANGNFTLGRPWGSGTPTCYYINTTMNVQPSAGGWSDMSGGYPKQFAEYNSMTSTGTTIDLSGRRTSWTDKSGTTHANVPALTTAEAEEISDMSNMFGDWDPTYYTEQASAPTNVVLTDSVLTWDSSDYVLCWAVCKNDSVQTFTTEPTFTVSDTNATWSVRAANEMGGLGDATVATVTTAIKEIGNNAEAVSSRYYNLQGLRTSAKAQGVKVKVSTAANGITTAKKVASK